MARKLLITMLFFSVISEFTLAQLPQSGQFPIFNTYNRDYIYNAKKMESTITLDGVLDEADWHAAQVADNFYLVLPVDTGYPQQPSEILLTYDDKAFYMAITFFDTVPGKRIAESFRRDFNFGNNDNFLVFFDTFLDQTTGFTFGVSASGAVWDGIMFDGHRVNLDWDSKTESKTKHYDDRWVTEMRIPFRSVRYPKDSQTWFVNFSRQDLKTNEKSSWAPVPRQFPTASLAYTGVLHFDQPLPKPSLNFSIIPYLFSSFHENKENGGGKGWRNDFGFDAKVGISSAMNLDLTYNPDFAQVEVDQQQMNVDRFELFYPEKRQFFLENSDLFSGYGYGNSVTPFFSRRIGLDAPVLGGARISGKIGNNLRIGFMNMTTEKTGEHLSRNFTVLSLQQKLFARSNLSFIMVNKEYLKQPEGSDLYNRVAGLDYNLASSNNFWTGKFFYHRSFQPGDPDKQYAQGASVGYSRKNIKLEMSQTSVGDNYRAETGFVRRTGYNFWGPELRYIFVPNKRVASHGPFTELEFYYNGSDLIDMENTYGYSVEFRDRTNISAGMKDLFVQLQSDFDPTHSVGYILPKGNEYRSQLGFVEFVSDNRKLFKYFASVASGKLYGVNFNQIEGRLNYRYQPYANLSLNFTYTDMLLPQPYDRTSLLLIGPKLDLTFTDKLFLSTFMQYNEQIDNVNLNVRFQWRYQPVSDLFVVYTDNYLPGSWNSRNRALVFKLTYWLN